MAASKPLDCVTNYELYKRNSNGVYYCLQRNQWHARANYKYSFEIEGVTYLGVHLAADALNISADLVYYRTSNANFPRWKRILHQP